MAWLLLATLLPARAREASCCTSACKPCCWGVPKLHHLGPVHYFAGLEADPALVYSQLLGLLTDDQPCQLPKQLQLLRPCFTRCLFLASLHDNAHKHRSAPVSRQREFTPAVQNAMHCQKTWYSTIWIVHYLMQVALLVMGGNICSSRAILPTSRQETPAPARSPVLILPLRLLRRFSILNVFNNAI